MVAVAVAIGVIFTLTIGANIDMAFGPAVIIGDAEVIGFVISVAFPLLFG